MGNGSLKVVLGVVGALILATLAYVMALSSSQAAAGERIRANEVRIEVVDRRLDRMESKIDAIGAAVHADMSTVQQPRR